MILFLVLSALIWGVGWKLKTPTSARWTMIGLLYVAMLLLLILLPAGNPLDRAFGGSVGNWLVVGALTGLLYAYFWGLKRLRRHVRPENRPIEDADDNDGPFSDSEIERYARHLVLREIGGPGQMRMKQARVLVVGAGGLGSPALLYLAGAGIGTIGVIDDDVVENANLQRQIIHSDETIDLPKVFSAQKAMLALNPHINVRPYHRRLTAELARELIADYDLVLDGTDNFDTRYMVNEACVAASVPLISGAITQWEGQIGVYDPSRGAPCYRCVFPERPAAGLAPSCAEAGVIGPLPGVIGAMMAVEAIKVVTDAGETLRGNMLIYDGLYGESRRIAVRRDPACSVCGKAATDAGVAREA